MHGDSDLFLMNPEHFNTLLHAYLDGTLSPLQKLELEQALRDSVEHRAQFWKQTELHGQLRGVSENEALWRGLEQASEIQMVSSRSRSWFCNPLAAAAAGFVLCLFCTSSVRAYMGQWVSKVRPLPMANGGFEEQTKIEDGVPTVVGVWSGDYSRVVGAENGVTPYQGGKMLRFVRANNELSDPRATRNVGEIHQIIDLRPFHADLATGKAQVEISARFAAGTQDSGYYFSLQAISFQGPIEWAVEAWNGRDRYGRTAAERVVEASWPAGRPAWQKLQLNLPVLTGTDFLILHGAVTRLPKPKEGVVEFPAHYMDDVTAQLRINRVEGDS